MQSLTNSIEATIALQEVTNVVKPIEATIALQEVTNVVKPIEATYQGATQVKVLSPEIVNI